jgi:NADPH:quinone reductase-like Zn-dependent oxidoreductase
VLIHAAGGGVGHLAVQIAKARGAHVVGTASAGKHADLVALGLDEAIDHRTEDVAEATRDIDVAVDLTGQRAGVAGRDASRGAAGLCAFRGARGADREGARRGQADHRLPRRALTV